MAPETEPRRKLRINAKNLFLTWPKNEGDSADIMNRIVEHFGMENISYVCVSEEEHEDGTPHLHAVVCLKAKTDIKDAIPILDSIGGKHGNYQAARKVLDVIKYVKKGGHFVETGDCPESKTEKITSLVANALRNGQSLEQVDEMDPGFFLKNQRAIKEYSTFQQRKKLKATPPRPPLVMSRFGHQFEIGYPREHKQKQYWIYGPPNTGKTTLALDLLSDGFRGFQIPENSDFSAFDDSYDFAYIDEFNGQLTVQFLNLWLEGVPMWLNTKGGSVRKTKNIPTFIFSNLPPDRVYWKTSQEILDTLLVRLIVIQTK